MRLAAPESTGREEKKIAQPRMLGPFDGSIFPCHTGAMGHRQKCKGSHTPSTGSLPEDLRDYAQPVQRRRVRSAKALQTGCKVRDDWPDEVPVTLTEVEVFEAWFGELLDELFGPF
uniref:hypothetical protein n=1 Tax=Bradyrhizobium sp. (strain ORS 278) TaxID=114615 RepID=UPI0012FF3BF3|nr:hypothetical protein [Bradyrhizobium sp. ORS 278]